MHDLVRLCEPDGIYLPQSHELGQGSKNGLYRALPLALHIPPQWALHPGDVTQIFRTVIGNAELLLLCALAQAATA